MDSLIQYVYSFNPDLPLLIKTGCILLLGSLLLSLIGRFVFGKNSVLNTAVSSAIGILFIYAITIVCSSLGGELSALVAPLPFASISENQLTLFSFQSADYTQICSELTAMIILAFFVNIADNLLPRGKGVIGWFFLRLLTLAIAFVMHLLIDWATRSFLPEGIVTYAPTILLAILILMMLTGALKLLVGLVLTTINPLIAALYTFFFANVIGKQISKAVLTTAILAGLVMLLNYLGCSVIAIASGVLIAYIPFAVLLICLWYLVSHKL